MILLGLLMLFALGALLVGLAVVFAIFSAFGARLHRPRRLVAGLAIVGLVSLAGAVAVHARLDDLELLAMRPELERIQERAVPLIAAIERFESERGRELEQLDELVPDYIDAIPDPGVGRFEWRAHDGGATGLVVGLSRGLITFDSFFYSPEVLPVESDGLTRRFGDWVYYLE